MTYKEYKELTNMDRLRYPEKSFFKLWLFNGCFRLIHRYRIVCFLRAKRCLFLAYCVERYLYNRLCGRLGCNIPSSVKIGGGFKIDHANGVIINSKAIIGNNCSVKSGVVIGSNDSGVPVIGNDVLIGVHALLIGGIKIGNRAKIGAGAIVVHDVKDGATMICEPAHVKGE